MFYLIDLQVDSEEFLLLNMLHFMDCSGYLNLLYNNNEKLQRILL